MNFGNALAILKAGGSVARNGWNGPGLWLTLHVPDAKSEMTLPYIYMSYPKGAKNTPGARVPWLASQTDMLAEDWQTVMLQSDIGVNAPQNSEIVSTPQTTDELNVQIAKLKELLSACEPAVYSAHMLEYGTRVAKPFTLLACVRDVIALNPAG